ncbi:AcrR family transcriptional regulator [Metabacillus crassostreae]|uniref:TetR/AcrR family transcriptional regulator n=1 Tax=Metabacillus crassostreae TaxID=929098 RepID=UPI00195AA9EA|nr:TetR/AcrR family transcriptional regulator [Metabacillus crassostreae]MBM7605929.1 AcrR family transcriptional regulator [Metabacillus crassostreae]
MPTQTFSNLPEDKKNQVIEAAVDEFFDKGYEKMSISKMISKAKIPRGSFYQYFEDKDDLYKYIIIEIIGNRKSHYSTQLTGKIDEMKFIPFIRALFIIGLDFYKNEPKLAVIATDFLTIRNQELKREIEGNSQKASQQFFMSTIENRKRTGEISEEIDSEMLIYLINTINATFANYFLEHRELGFDNTELINYIDRLLFILQNGIASN